VSRVRITRPEKARSHDSPDFGIRYRLPALVYGDDGDGDIVVPRNVVFREWRASSERQYRRDRRESADATPLRCPPVSRTEEPEHSAMLQVLKLHAKHVIQLVKRYRVLRE
jgi:hypothetical protein